MTLEKALLLTAGFGVLGLLVVAGCATYGFEFLPFIGIFLVGWLSFLVRVLGDAPWAATGLLALGVVLLTGLVQLVCSSIYPRIRKAKHPEEVSPPRWQLRWTVGWLGLVLLFLVSGILLLGLSQHSFWLATSPDPMINHSWGLPNTSGGRLHDMGRAFWQYCGDRDGLPAGARKGKQGRLLHSWQTSLLPFLDDGDKGAMKAFYERINHDVPWNDPANVACFRMEVQTYQNPQLTEKVDAEGFALSHYAANSRMLGGTKAQRMSTLGLYHNYKILAGEVSTGFKPWGQPGNWRDPAAGLGDAPHTFGSRSWRGVDFLFVSGHVHRVRYNVDPQVLKALADPKADQSADVFSIIE